MSLGEGDEGLICPKNKHKPFSPVYFKCHQSIMLLCLAASCNALVLDKKIRSTLKIMTVWGKLFCLGSLPLLWMQKSPYDLTVMGEAHFLLTCMLPCYNKSKSCSYISVFQIQAKLEYPFICTKVGNNELQKVCIILSFVPI